MNLTLVNALKLVSSTAGVVVLVVGFHSYFAKAEELQQVKAYTEYTFDELRLEKLDEKLSVLKVKPTTQQQQWEKEKIILLESQKQKIIRRMNHSVK